MALRKLTAFIFQLWCVQACLSHHKHPRHSSTHPGQCAWLSVSHCWSGLTQLKRLIYTSCHHIQPHEMWCHFFGRWQSLWGLLRGRNQLAEGEKLWPFSKSSESIDLTFIFKYQTLRFWSNGLCCVGSLCVPMPVIWHVAAAGQKWLWPSDLNVHK